MDWPPVIPSKFGPLPSSCAYGDDHLSAGRTALIGGWHVDGEHHLVIDQVRLGSATLFAFDRSDDVLRYERPVKAQLGIVGRRWSCENTASRLELVLLDISPFTDSVIGAATLIQ